MTDKTEQALVPYSDDDVEREAARRDTLSRLGGELEARKDECVTHKTIIETRMLLDEAQYWGSRGGTTTKTDTVAGLGNNRGASDGSPKDNKTRSKTRIASARIGDMLFPTNSPNWGLRPTPDPEVSIPALQAEYEAMMAKIPPPQEGQPAPEPPPIDEQLLASKVAVRACRKMSRKIKDTLSESQYAKIGRAVINDGCKLGTGIIKGPYVRNRIKRKYDTVETEGTSVEVLSATVEKQPAVARVSPWMFFPQRARCIEECEHAFELHLFTKTQLQKMVMTHGFDRKVTADLIKAGPTRGTVDGMLAQRAAITGDGGQATHYEQCWATWEYHGPIGIEVLQASGLMPEGEENPLLSFYGEVWFINGEVVRINLSPLEADSELPYQVWCYEEDETSVFGFGVPFIMRDDQVVIDMMWDAMTHNAAVSAGPQIAILKGVVTPADGSFHIRGPKLWYVNDEDMHIQNAIQTMVIPSTVNTNMPLYQQAKQNADENTNLPMLAGGGEAQQVGQQMDGKAAVMNQQNIVQRAAAHSWDDNITGRLLPRLYDWFMQHDDDPAIKGDFEVEVRGASYLLVKEVQAQHAQMLIQMAAQDPTMAGMLQMEELYRVYLGFMDIPTAQLIKSSEEIERDQQNAQPDPMHEADLRLKNAQAAEIEMKVRQAEGGGEGQPAPMSEVEYMKLELEYARLADKEAERGANMQIENMRAQTQMMRVASDENISYEKIRADMEKFSRSQASDDYFKAASLRLDEFRDRLKAINLSRGHDTFG